MGFTVPSVRLWPTLRQVTQALCCSSSVKRVVVPAGFQDSYRLRPFLACGAVLFLQREGVVQVQVCQLEHWSCTWQAPRVLAAVQIFWKDSQDSVGLYNRGVGNTQWN